MNQTPNWQPPQPQRPQQSPQPQQPQQPQQYRQPQQGQYPPPQQPYPGQYPQYPGQPGFPQRPRQPAWVVVLIVVAVVAVVISAVLGGILIGGRLANRSEADPVSGDPFLSESWESALESEPQPSLPERADPPAESLPAPALPDDGGLVGECLDEAIDWIEDFPTFVKDYEWEPLGCVADFDDDGYQDFLAVYQCQAGNGTRYVGYGVFTFREDGPQLLLDGVLYQEVGGNSGSLGIATGKDGTVYLTRFTKKPDGDGPHNFYEYIPWDNLGVTEDNIFRMESQWSVEDPERGTYLLGERKVDRETFEASRSNYVEYYSLDIMSGPGNSDMNGVDFDTLKQWYGE